MGAGGAAGLLGFSKVMTFLIDNIGVIMIFLFLGVTVGGLPVLFKRAEIKPKKITPLSVLLFIIGAGVVIAMSYTKTTIVNLATSEGLLMMLFMVLSGFLYAIALILPGISGMFFLLTIGLYEITMGALDISNLNLPYLIPLAIGILLGVALTTRLLENLMNKHSTGTYLVIIGFVIGSLYVVFAENIPGGIDILFASLSFIVGFFITFILSKTTAENKNCI